MARDAILYDVFSFSTKKNVTGLYYIMMSETPSWGKGSTLFCTTYYNSPAEIEYISTAKRVTSDDSADVIDVVKWTKQVQSTGLATCMKDLTALLEDPDAGAEEIRQYIDQAIASGDDKTAIGLAQHHATYLGGGTICPDHGCEIETIRRMIKKAWEEESLS